MLKTRLKRSHLITSLAQWKSASSMAVNGNRRASGYEIKREMIIEANTRPSVHIQVLLEHFSPDLPYEKERGQGANNGARGPHIKSDSHRRRSDTG